MRVYLPKNKKKRRRFYLRTALLVGILLFIILGLAVSCAKWINYKKGNYESFDFSKENPMERPELEVSLLTVNEYSRPAIPLKKINGIVIHYVANPGSTAMENRNYFEGLKDGRGTKASSHFIIGLEGEIVQCIPTVEIAYASNGRNNDTLSIECCHTEEDGKFNSKTYQSLVRFTAWLCLEFHIEVEDVIRHYDVTGKNCPKYYVEHEKEWFQFRNDVEEFMKQQLK